MPIDLINGDPHLGSFTALLLGSAVDAHNAKATAQAAYDTKKAAYYQAEADLATLVAARKVANDALQGALGGLIATFVADVKNPGPTEPPLGAAAQAALDSILTLRVNAFAAQQEVLDAKNDRDAAFALKLAAEAALKAADEALAGATQTALTSFGVSSLQEVLADYQSLDPYQALLMLGVTGLTDLDFNPAGC